MHVRISVLLTIFSIWLSSQVLLSNATAKDVFGIAELAFTHGESGLPRSNSFVSGEKVFAAIRISGVDDPQLYSGQIQVTASVLDAKGREVLKVEKPLEEYSQLLGGGLLETTLTIDSDRKGIPPGKYSLEILIRQSPTGHTCEVRRDFIWENVQSLCSSEYDWFLDKEKIYSAGPMLQAGRFYTLGKRMGNFSFVDRAFAVQSRTNLFRKNGMKAIGSTPLSSVNARVPSGMRLPERAWDQILLEFVQTGEVLLTEDLTDLPSGNQAKASIPVIVGGAGVPANVDSRAAAPFLILTHGKHGAVRQSDYLIGEDIWMSLGFVDATRGGSSTQKLHVYFLDEKGEIVTDFSLGESEVLSGFDEPFFVSQMQFGVEPERGGPVEPVRKIQIRLTEKVTGNQTIVSAPIRFVPVRGLAAMDLRLSADRHDHVPGGQFLTAGRTYYLQGHLTKFAVKDYAIDVTHKVRPFTEDGQPIAGMELVLDYKRQLSVAEKFDGRVPLAMEINANRPGKFLLRSTFTDNISGETFTADLPIEVVSPFQFVDKRN